MKKNLYIMILIFLFITPLFSALTFEMKDTFGQEETLMAKIVGDLTKPPVRENIYFYKGHVRVAIDPYVAKINEDYYIYASLGGKTPENYSLVIKNIEYKKGTKTIKEDLVKNFTVTEEFVDFIINPGFVVTNNDFDITLENLQDKEIEVMMNITTLSGEEGGISNYEEDTDYIINVKPGKEKINFKLDFLEASTEKMIVFSYENLTYQVPISLFIDEQSQQAQLFAFKIEPSELDLTLPTNFNKTKLIYIYNTGTGTLTDIRLELDDSLFPYVTISEDRFGRIIPNSNAHLNMVVVTGGEKTIGGSLKVYTEQGLYNEMRISIKVKEDYELSPEEAGSELSTDQNCDEIGGKICLDDETCEGDEFPANDDMCCIGECKKIPSKAPMRIIGWIILLLLIIVGIWFYFKKYRGVKTPVDLLKIAQGKKSQ